MSWHGKTPPSEISSKNQPQMALPSVSKKRLVEALYCRVGWGGEPFYSFPLHDFSSRCLNLVDDPTLSRPRPNTTERRSSTWSYDFWLVVACPVEITSLTHAGGQILCFIFIVSNRHFGNKKGSRVWNWLGCCGGESLIGESQDFLCRNPALESSMCLSIGLGWSILLGVYFSFNRY